MFLRIRYHTTLNPQETFVKSWYAKHVKHQLETIFRGFVAKVALSY
jgi:hypothetical protein